MFRVDRHVAEVPAEVQDLLVDEMCLELWRPVAFSNPQRHYRHITLNCFSASCWSNEDYSWLLRHADTVELPAAFHELVYFKSPEKRLVASVWKRFAECDSETQDDWSRRIRRHDGPFCVYFLERYGGGADPDAIHTISHQEAADTASLLRLLQSQEEPIGDIILDEVIGDVYITRVAE